MCCCEWGLDFTLVGTGIVTHFSFWVTKCEVLLRKLWWLLWRTARKTLQLENNVRNWTWNYPLRIKRVEGIIHKHPGGSGLILSQSVPHNHRVVAVVDVGGLVEEETTMLHWSVGCVRDELGESVCGLLELLVFVQPGDDWIRIAVHCKGETPVMLRLCVPQEEDFGWNCGEMTDLEVTGG